MMALRGLFFIFLFVSSLGASYLIKDELIHNPSFEEQINIIGSELKAKGGVSLYVATVASIGDLDIESYAKEILKTFDKPSILLIMSEANSKVDIVASDEALYKLFNKKEILSPVSSVVQAFVMALFYSHGYDSFMAMLGDYGGSILPVLAQKVKPEELSSKYAVAMFNGYADIASQIAKSKNFKLDSDIGDANKNSIFLVKVIFYGFIAYAIFLIIRRKIAK